MTTNNIESLITSLGKRNKAIRADAQKTFLKKEADIERAFASFNAYLKNLKKEKNKELKNIKLVLANRLFNHVYAMLILAESGLIHEAIILERCAIETFAMKEWASLNSDNRDKYFSRPSLPKLSTVKKDLRTSGFYAANELGGKLIDLANGLGDYVHNNAKKNHRFIINWYSKNKGQLNFGGRCPLEGEVKQIIDIGRVIIHLFIGGPAE